jgi:hypothetical protein
MSKTPSTMNARDCSRPKARRIRSWAAALALSGGLLAAGRAQADTLFLEAEGLGKEGKPLSNEDAKITSPLQVKDDAAASLGRYVTVAPGLNSAAAPPAAEGVATYPFSVGTAGNYRIWGRVIAPTTADDSFWVRVTKVGTSTTTLVNWNGIDPGTAWHWALVKPSGAPAAAQFALEANVQYELQISYREDGTKIDAMIITSDAAFNPKTPPTTAPELPPEAFDEPLIIPRSLTAGAKTGIKVFWSEVPGAKSYTLKRFSAGVPLPSITGLTTHVFTETKLPTNDNYNCYDLTAIFADGTSRSYAGDRTICETLRYERTFLDTASTLSGAAPMIVDQENVSAYSTAGTASSSAAPPAHGRIRFDFAVGGPAKLQLWFVMNVPDTAHDSFWARMDDGAWIKWNNIPSGCSPVSNSDAGGARVTFSVAAGTHRFELATRETGVVSGFPAPSLSNIFFITDSLTATPRLCDD